MNGVPLIAGFAPGAVFARAVVGGVRTAITREQFLGDVARLATLLPPRGHVLNLCADRYRFIVGLCAALLREQVSLLPPNQTPQLLAQLAKHYPGFYCLTDHENPRADAVVPQGAAAALETVIYPQDSAAPSEALPWIPAQQLAAIVFTSGSTGTPVPNLKTWGRLVQSAQAEIARLGVPRGMSLLATVPPQHMYGLESTVLMPMQGGMAIHAGRPFYPADIAAELEHLPRPRGLVTTPVHLRTLLADSETLPQADFLLCATAPLAEEAAAQAEAVFGTPLYEIYGCTEAGQVATRRTTDGAQWRTLPGVKLAHRAPGTCAMGGHVEEETLLNDVIELADPEHFELRGRTADLINIAGKRTSLAHLNFQLNAIEGVRDGVFVMPDEADGEMARLTALVVAPGLSPAALNQALRGRIDAVFMPRPLYFVEALPRNSTGKLTRQALDQLLAQLAGANQDKGKTP